LLKHQEEISELHKQRLNDVMSENRDKIKSLEAKIEVHTLNRSGLSERERTLEVDKMSNAQGLVKKQQKLKKMISTMSELKKEKLITDSENQTLKSEKQSLLDELSHFNKINSKLEKDTKKLKFE